jgi:hypothetical protein
MEGENTPSNGYKMGNPQKSAASQKVRKYPMPNKYRHFLKRKVKKIPVIRDLKMIG